MRGFLGGCDIGALQGGGIEATSCAPWRPTLAAGMPSLGGLHGCVRSCRPVWELLGCCQLAILPIEWGRRHGYLLLESGEINLLPPQLGQVIFQIQERVPVTSFEDWIRGLKVAHHLHWAGLPNDRIYQQATVVLWLQDSRIQSVIVLCPVGYDKATPCIFSVLLGISVTELQGGSAYTTVQACPCGTVRSVEMIGLSTFDISGGIHQTIGRVLWDGNNATEIVHKEAIGMPLAGVTPSLESVTHLPEVDIYVLDEVIDLARAV